jgi:hypothetical protein
MLGRLELRQARIKRSLRGAACALVPVVGGIVGWVPPVAAATPVIITSAIEAGVSGVTAKATLAGGDDPTGTVTFRGFGPGDDTCARAPLFTSTNPVIGTGTPKQATSDFFTVTAPGAYHFVATYNGDARNAPAGPTPCDDPNATYGIGSSSYAFSARASAPVALGGTVSDTATIATSSSSGPTGTMSFALFGPGAPTCTGAPVFTSSRPVQGNGSYTSDPFVPTAPGTYRWVASYSGDADDASALTSCANPGQQVEVRAADPSSPGIQCAVRARPLGGLAALLQDLVANPLAALLGRLNGLTACGAALLAG